MLKKILLNSVVLLIMLASEGFCVEYNIDNLLTTAEENSANIQAFDLFAQSQKSFANQQKYWSNPIISATKSNSQNSFSLSQEIPYFNKLANKYNIENSEFKIQENRRNSLILEVKSQVFKLAYQNFILQNKIQLTQNRLDRLSLIRNYLANIALDSPNRQAQSIIAQDRIKLVQRDLIILNNQLRQNFNNLNIFLNLPNQPKITLKWLDKNHLEPKENLVQRAFENNLNLQGQKFTIEKYRGELAYAKIEQMPNVNIHGQMQDSSNSASSSSSQASNGIGLSLSVPIINQNKEKIFSAESKIKAQNKLYEFEKNQLEKIIENDILQYQTQLKNSQIFAINLVPKIIARLNKANVEFKKGILDFITYIELDMQEYQTIDAIFEAQYLLAESFSDLMVKIGDFSIPQNLK
jgi:outer membrane protein TolC